MSNPDLCVVGGAGRVGFPLALVFAKTGRRVLIHDINAEALEKIRRGEVPFMEAGAQPLLRKALALERLLLTEDAASLEGVPVVIVTIGTPIDELFNPNYQELMRAIEPLVPFLSDEQLIVLRSTVYPGTTAWLERFFSERGLNPAIACCPERVVEGRVIEELQTLPQIVSGMTPDAERRSAELFSCIAPQVVRLAPMEAEFAKLFCNAYRYIQFATANQFYMIAHSAGLDYYRILRGVQQDYARMRDLPKAGFSAGPCLLKDTMQMSAFYHNAFSLGYTAMLINEGLPLYVVQQLSTRCELTRMTVGLLGMAFKADIDDPRASLSYKLKKALLMRAKRVLCSDPYVPDPDLVPLETVIAQSDLLILCVPHRVYQSLDFQGKPVIDLWNFLGKGGMIEVSPNAVQQPVAAP